MVTLEEERRRLWPTPPRLLAVLGFPFALGVAFGTDARRLTVVARFPRDADELLARFFIFETFEDPFANHKRVISY